MLRPKSEWLSSSKDVWPAELTEVARYFPLVVGAFTIAIHTGNGPETVIVGEYMKNSKVL